MSFKRRMVRRQPPVLAASEMPAGHAAGASPELAASSLPAWEVAQPRVTRYTPVNVDRGRVASRRTGGKASGHR